MKVNQKTKEKIAKIIEPYENIESIGFIIDYIKKEVGLDNEQIQKH